jgi:hypothetical protein
LLIENPPLEIGNRDAGQQHSWHAGPARPYES